MRTINISISESECKRYGIKREHWLMDEFIELVGKEINRRALKRSLELAEKSNLDSLSMGQITKEVKAVRKHAKNH